MNASYRCLSRSPLEIQARRESRAAYARILNEAGHDALTVVDQKLHGVPDQQVYEICRRERRCLVTLDLDFANVFRFPPESTAGIVVLRPSDKTTINALTTLVEHLVVASRRERLDGRLWIVETGRIRIHQAPDID